MIRDNYNTRVQYNNQTLVLQQIPYISDSGNTYECIAVDIMDGHEYRVWWIIRYESDNQDEVCNWAIADDVVKL